MCGSTPGRHAGKTGRPRLPAAPRDCPAHAASPPLLKSAVPLTERGPGGEVNTSPNAGSRSPSPTTSQLIPAASCCPAASRRSRSSSFPGSRSAICWADQVAVAPLQAGAGHFSPSPESARSHARNTNSRRGQPPPSSGQGTAHSRGFSPSPEVRGPTLGKTRWRRGQPPPGSAKGLPAHTASPPSPEVRGPTFTGEGAGG